MISYLCERCGRAWDNGDYKRLIGTYYEALTAIALCTNTADLYNAETRILSDMDRLKHVRSYEWHMSRLLFEINLKQAEILKQNKTA